VFGVFSRIDKRAERSGALDFPSHLIRLQAEMFCKKPILDVPDAAPDLRVSAGVHGQIAFCVDPHGSPGEVRRPDPDQRVVNDHHLRMDKGRYVLRA
jgi:hypothetical protein